METKEQKQKHFAYIKEKGPFEISFDFPMLNTEQINFLKKYGHWLDALSKGILEPFTDLQKAFIEVAHNERSPVTPEEKSWFTYCFRLEYDKKYGTDFSGPRRTIKDNSFTQEGNTSPYENESYSQRWDMTDRNFNEI
jgi:uncharacterized protein YifE (UPF0438 family)